jgi:hypothetical protein
MALHVVSFDYKLPEGSVYEMDLDESLDQSEKEELALAEIKEIYDDVEDIQINSIIKL